MQARVPFVRVPNSLYVLLWKRGGSTVRSLARPPLLRSDLWSITKARVWSSMPSSLSSRLVKQIFLSARNQLGWLNALVAITMLCVSVCVFARVNAILFGGQWNGRFCQSQNIMGPFPHMPFCFWGGGGVMEGHVFGGAKWNRDSGKICRSVIPPET